jgi:hypothetical protein
MDFSVVLLEIASSGDALPRDDLHEWEIPWPRSLLTAS